MRNSDKIYLLMETLGHDVKKIIQARHEEILHSKEYDDIYKQLWMMRVQPTLEAQMIASRIKDLRTFRVESYFDTLTLEQEIEQIALQGDAQVTINPYIYNHHRKYPVKTIGELKIPYAKTMININEYILGAELASDKKIRFLTNAATEWYQMADKDITNGIEKTTNVLKEIEVESRFRFPLMRFFQLFILFGLIANAVMFMAGNVNMYVFARAGDFKSDIFGLAMIYGHFVIGVAAYIVTTIIALRGRFYHFGLRNRAHRHLKSYQKLLATLATKHNLLRESIERSVNAKTFLRLAFTTTAVITPTTYAFDEDDVAAAIITKNEFTKRHRAWFITSFIFFGLFLVLTIVLGLRAGEVF